MTPDYDAYLARLTEEHLAGWEDDDRDDQLDYLDSDIDPAEDLL
ncbi:hypothetical protein SAMN04515671_2950 [Nakamurella panacisegetis]|uniref:Uncharacterized protein n=1 Tax=Nakamurella panacisegetis TaxID=1090615 RepID=A0A1H0Q121_9ACTN|nr:hypothetical protein [Nakamurella panacisegetis]SDP10705.1 hypothetical protein SAMN04515671_2950 [Nakamurella panacisegetis]